MESGGVSEEGEVGFGEVSAKGEGREVVGVVGSAKKRIANKRDSAADRGRDEEKRKDDRADATVCRPRTLEKPNSKGETHSALKA